MALTIEEAVAFLTHVLELPSDQISLPPNMFSHELPSGSVKENRAKLLNSIIASFQAKEPFQCISLMAIDPSQRRRPKWSEIKESMFLNRGGICYSMNSFVFVLLRTLGFDVSLSHSTVVAGVPCPDNHVLVLIHSLLEDGDLFLVDVGTGYSMARAVPLDFDENSPVYTESYHTYKLARRSSNRIVLLQRPVRSIAMNAVALTWCQLTTDASGLVHYDDLAKIHSGSAENESLDPESGWREFYFFDPTQRHQALDEFYSCFDVCYGDVSKLTMHSTPRAICWPRGRVQGIVVSKLVLENSKGEMLKHEIGDILNCDKPASERGEIVEQSDLSHHEISAKFKHSTSKCCICQDLALAEESSSYRMDALGLQADAKLIKVYQKMFPQLPQNMVEAALKNWRTCDKPTKLPAYI